MISINIIGNANRSALVEIEILICVAFDRRFPSLLGDFGERNDCLRILMSFVPDEEIIILVEDKFGLHLAYKHLVSELVQKLQFELLFCVEEI